MSGNLASISLRGPTRTSNTDDPAEILGFAVKEFRNGRVALATLVEIRGGAARALGSHVAVTADGGRTVSSSLRIVRVPGL
jgi:xanthine dehydrogenase accessory factor